MHSMVVLVLHNLTRFEEVLSAWHEAGASAVTILESVGTRGPREQARREDLPLLPSIRDLLQSDDAPRKTVFSIVRDELVERLIQTTTDIVGDLQQPGNGILFVIPVTRVEGLREP